MSNRTNVCIDVILLLGSTMLIVCLVAAQLAEMADAASFMVWIAAGLVESYIAWVARMLFEREFGIC